MAWTRASSRIEPGRPGPGGVYPAGPAAPETPERRDEHIFRARDSLLIEPPRRRWRLVLAGVALLLAGGVLGVMLTVELLDSDLPARTRQQLSGNEAPAVTASAAVAEKLRRDAERLLATAELAALRQASAAEREKLQGLARQRSAAEAELAALQDQARALAVLEQPPPAPVAPVAAAVPPVPPVVAPSVVPPSAAAATPAVPRQAARSRAEARQDGRLQLYYLAGSAVAQQAAEDAAAALRDAGVDGVELRAVAEVPANRIVRYHRAEDAGMAARLAGRLGRGWALQDSRSFDPGSTARGMEIWLPDR